MLSTEGWEKTWGKLSQDETVRQKWFRRAHRPVHLTDDYILQAIHRKWSSLRVRLCKLQSPKHYGDIVKADTPFQLFYDRTTRSICLKKKEISFTVHEEIIGLNLGDNITLHRETSNGVRTCYAKGTVMGKSRGVPHDSGINKDGHVVVKITEVLDHTIHENALRFGHKLSVPLQEISKNPEANRNQDERLDRMERDIQTVANKVVNVEKKVNNVEKKTIKDNQKVVELLKKRKPGRKRKVDTEGLVGAQKENQNISQEQAAVTKEALTVVSRHPDKRRATKVNLQAISGRK